jgi:phosphate transport system protein
MGARRGERRPAPTAHENGDPLEARKSFHEAMAELKSDVIRLAAIVGESIGASTDALLAADLRSVEQVVSNDAAVDELSHSVEARAFELIALQQPTAGDLRTLLAILRILHELELTGDLTTTIAKGARRLYPYELTPRVRGLLERMGAQASIQLHLAVDAFADVEESLASALPDLDDLMDDFQKQLFRAIFETIDADEAGLQQAVQIALIGRYYERVADHAVQIGRWVGFMITGELPGASMSGADRDDTT